MISYLFNECRTHISMYNRYWHHLRGGRHQLGLQRRHAQEHRHQVGSQVGPYLSYIYFLLKLTYRPTAFLYIKREVIMPPNISIH